MVQNAETQITPTPRVIGQAKIAEVAEFFGISRTRIYQLMQNEQLSRAIVGGEDRIVLDDLFWYATSKRRKTLDDLEEEAIREEEGTLP